MATQAVKHGSEAGYREEMKTDSVCNRCRNAHRLYSRKSNKKNGISYGYYDVIDHLYVRPSRQVGVKRSVTGQGQSGAARSDTPTTSTHASGAESYQDGPGRASAATGEGQSDPSLGDRLRDGLGRVASQFTGNPYVESEDAPDYITASEPDPEPKDDEWDVITEDELVITKEGLNKIEENLGTYLSVLGITFEMIDPYCGPILAENFDNIVGRWTKVIARYPRAAKLFLSKDGGTLFTWIGAIQATWPVLYAIYEHHLSKTIQTDKQGRVYRVSPNGNAPDVDATMPPQPEYDYSVQ